MPEGRHALALTCDTNLAHFVRNASGVPRRSHIQDPFRMRIRSTTAALAALLGLVPVLAHAESNVSTGAGSPLTANARLDFQIVAPKILYLRVGNGADLAAN